jgi:hypothetical protein
MCDIIILRLTKKVVDAAAVSMMQSMFAPHELPLPPDLRRKYRYTARNAVTAAIVAAASESNQTLEIRDRNNAPLHRWPHARTTK